MEDGDNRERRACAVGNPISPRLHPCAARPGDAVVFVGARGRKPGGGIGRDLLPSVLQSRDKVTDRLGPLAFLIVLPEGADLAPRAWGEDDQMPGGGPGSSGTVCRASSRAMLS